MKFTLLTVLTLTLSATSWACTMDGKEGFLPKNDLYIPVDTKAPQGLNQSQFDSIIDKVETIYSREIASLGKKLVIDRNWVNGEVNAYATRMGQEWKVAMFGGLARHSAITPDGFALVVCHELGHHIGGAPKKTTGNGWSSAEGQADYFATLKCLRQVFLHDNNAAIVKRLRPPVPVLVACGKAHSREDRLICIRSAMAGDSVARLFSSLGGEKASLFHTPSTAAVTQTYEGHPATQCRLDTFFQGALCGKSFNEDVSQIDEVRGTCHGKTNHRHGLRPRCWFKPKA